MREAGLKENPRQPEKPWCRWKPVYMRRMRKKWMTGVIACGSGPLDAAADAEKLVVPEYNGLDSVPYSAFLMRTPDQIRVVEYAAADAGNEDAKPLGETVCESPYYIGLKKNRIYDITASWAEEKLEENGFYGEAEYFIVTE